MTLSAFKNHLFFHHRDSLCIGKLTYNCIRDDDVFK